MKSYFVKVVENPNVFKIRTNVGPENYEQVWPVPESLENEDTRWLQWEQVEVTLPGGESELQWQVTINQVLKDELVISDAIASSERANREARQAEREEKKKRFAFGLDLKAEVSLINDSKGWTNAQFAAFAADPRIQKLSLLLNDGAIETALGFVMSIDLSTYYTQDDIDKITGMMNDFILENPTP